MRSKLKTILQHLFCIKDGVAPSMLTLKELTNDVRLNGKLAFIADRIESEENSIHFYTNLLWEWNPATPTEEGWLAFTNQIELDIEVIQTLNCTAGQIVLYNGKKILKFVSDYIEHLKKLIVYDPDVLFDNTWAYEDELNNVILHNDTYTWYDEESQNSITIKLGKLKDIEISIKSNNKSDMSISGSVEIITEADDDVQNDGDSVYYARKYLALYKEFEMMHRAISKVALLENEEVVKC